MGGDSKNPGKGGRGLHVGGAVSNGQRADRQNWLEDSVQHGRGNEEPGMAGRCRPGQREEWQCRFSELKRLWEDRLGMEGGRQGRSAV